MWWHEWISILCIIFSVYVPPFVYPWISMDGYLCCFHVWLLWMLLWTWMHKTLVLVPAFNSLGESKKWDCWIILWFLFLLCWGTMVLFSIATATDTFLSTAHKGSNFSTFLPTLIFCLFDSNHPNGCEVISAMDIILFPTPEFKFLCWNLIPKWWSLKMGPLRGNQRLTEWSSD